ncbi:MAG: hypothetical protein JO359_02165 [Candidatus Eremiobacteraeota bacterium]|nr:hypothetical protein [Candidatus Eremiobacteraeota bacterium]
MYREASNERDEILSLNGEKFLRPQVRIFTRRRDRYAVATIAPSPDAYAFSYVGTVKAGRHVDYVFRTAPHVPGTYAVTQVTIDGAAFLPRRVAFRTESGGVVGTGTIVYAKADRYWMPLSANARADVRGKLQTERISWGRYQFFPSLPSSTFALPRPAAG